MLGMIVLVRMADYAALQDGPGCEIAPEAVGEEFA
jgi:hypothetical protein